MLRLILWRLGYDFWNAVAALLTYDRFGWLQRYNRPVLNFAFGANLSPLVLRRRLIRPLAQQDYMLRDHTLEFSQAGPYRGFGFASVRFAPGEEVFGRLIEMSAVDAIRLDYGELLPFTRRHRRIICQQDGYTFYFYQATRPRPNLLPTDEYKAKIMQAAEISLIIPPEFLGRLQAVQTVPMHDPPERLQFMVSDYDVWWLLSPLVQKYDKLCIRLFRWLMAHSLTQSWLERRFSQQETC